MAGQNFFENWVSYSEEIPYGSKILSKSLLSSTVFEIKGFLCFAFLKKNSNILNGCHFWQVKYLLKLGKASLHRYPVGEKFCRNPTGEFLFYDENGFKKYSYISIVLYVYGVPYEPIFLILCFAFFFQKFEN